MGQAHTHTRSLMEPTAGGGLFKEGCLALLLRKVKGMPASQSFFSLHFFSFRRSPQVGFGPG